MTLRCSSRFCTAGGASVLILQHNEENTGPNHSQSAWPQYSTLSGVCDTPYKGKIIMCTRTLQHCWLTWLYVNFLSMFYLWRWSCTSLYKPSFNLSTPHQSQNVILPVLVAVVGAIPGDGTQLFAIATQRLGWELILWKQRKTLTIHVIVTKRVVLMSTATYR